MRNIGRLHGHHNFHVTRKSDILQKSLAHRFRSSLVFASNELVRALGLNSSDDVFLCLLIGRNYTLLVVGDYMVTEIIQHAVSPLRSILRNNRSAVHPFHRF